MIKEVDVIPKMESVPKPTRVGAIRSDIRTALANRIPKFEFVGEIYTPNGGQFTGYLKRAAVVDEADKVIHRYLYQRGIGDAGWNFVGRVYQVYSYREGACPERIYMEIYFDALDKISNQHK